VLKFLANQEHKLLSDVVLLLFNIFIRRHLEVFFVIHSYKIRLIFSSNHILHYLVLKNKIITDTCSQWLVHLTSLICFFMIFFIKLLLL